MASEKAVNQLMQTIIEKRRKLGLVDQGIVPVEEVIEKLNQLDEVKNKVKVQENLAEGDQDHQNNTR